MLLGEVEPSGRLPMTFPLSTGHIPTSTHQRPTGRLIRADVDHKEGRYIDALTYPRLPFGFGLTYTTVEYGAPTVSAADARPRTVRVDPLGDRDEHRRARRAVRSSSSTSATPSPQVTRPLVELTDWALVDLEPGQAREVTFEVTAEQFGVRTAAT